MANILCLAHFCETHGPTPLMVTEGLPVECTSCPDERQSFTTRRTSVASRSHSHANDNVYTPKASSRTNSTSSSNDKDSPSFRNSSSSAILDTPPESPQIPAAAPYPLVRDSSYRKTYDENDRKRAIPCDSCALTLPPKTNESISKLKLDTNGPMLRTRKPYQRVTLAPGPDDMPLQSNTSSEASDSENDCTAVSHHQAPLRPYMKRSTTSSSSTSSSSSVRSANNNSHEHYLDYTSTHEPLHPSSFSAIRQSCLRTLSVETLPPTTHMVTPTSSSYLSAFSSLSISTSTTSGGPIFFGDPQAGYTIAFIFRIPDPNARGKRRQYALICHSMHRERVAMSIYSLVGRAFADLAAWIQGLAEVQLERSQDSSLQSPRLGSIDEFESKSNGDYRRGSEGSTNGRSSLANSAFGSVRLRSSFHGGGMDSGRFAGGIGGAGGVMKGKGLAELVGLPDFFFELHARFVALLMRIGAV